MARVNLKPLPRRPSVDSNIDDRWVRDHMGINAEVPSGERQRSDAEPHVAHPKLVLVADDDRLIVATISHNLRVAGFQVIEAFDGPAALAAGASARPDLAILDHSMPGMSGLQVARALRETSTMPTIFLSAYSDPAIVDDAIAVGALAYIVKPIDSEQLLPIVRTALHRGREINALLNQNERLRELADKAQVVGAASGMLMGALRLDQREAMERLRYRARSRRVKLQDVASELLRVHREIGKLIQEYAMPPPRQDAGRDEKG